MSATHPTLTTLLRVDFSNNYSTRLTEERCATGSYPRQHMYGVDHLRAAGYDVRIVEHDPDTSLHRLSSRARWRLGDVRQLPRAIARGSTDAVDVAAEPLHVAGLAQLRAAGWRRQPLVAVFHSPLRPTAFARRMVSGVDVAVCLSKRVQSQLVETFGRAPEKTLWAPWGPDLGFTGYRSTGEEFVVSSGKTLRDPDLLVRALAGTGIPARVYGAQHKHEEVDVINALADRVPGSDPHMPYTHALSNLQRAAIVAIPLTRHERLVGLSEIADALALGKPIVVTRSPWLDVDVEEIGCGVVVDLDDEQGWRNALLDLWANRARRCAMGLAGRAFAEREFNANLFGETIVRAVQTAAVG